MAAPGTKAVAAAETGTVRRVAVAAAAAVAFCLAAERQPAGQQRSCQHGKSLFALDFSSLEPEAECHLQAESLLFFQAGFVPGERLGAWESAKGRPRLVPGQRLNLETID